MKKIKKNLKGNEKILLLTHNDMDGSGSAVLLKLLYGNNVEVKRLSNGAMDKVIGEICLSEEEMSKYDYVFITDISCSPTTANKIEKSPFASKVVLLDHHSTANGLNEFSFAFVASCYEKTFNVKENYGPLKSSGTSLMLDFLLAEDIQIPNVDLCKYFAHCVAAYDTWDWVYVFDKLETYKNLNSLYYIYGAEYFEDLMVTHLANGSNLFDDISLKLLAVEETKTKDYVDRKEKSMVVLSETIVGKKYSFAFCVAESYLADIFDRMYTNYPEVDFYVVDIGSGLSFRSRTDEMNVAELAKNFGGGGHPQASGCRVPYDLRILTVKSTLKCKGILKDIKVLLNERRRKNG